MCRTYANQFGADYAIPAEIAELVRTGKIADTSWGNDVCPSFSLVADGSIVLWVDHPDAEQSETQSQYRYVIQLVTDESEERETAIETNNLAALLAYMADQYDVK